MEVGLPRPVRSDAKSRNQRVGVCSSHSTPPQGPRVQHRGPTALQDRSRDLLPPVQSTLPSLTHEEGLARHTPQGRIPRPKELGTSRWSPESWGPEEGPGPPTPATTKPLLQAYSGFPEEVSR